MIKPPGNDFQARLAALFFPRITAGANLVYRETNPGNLCHTRRCHVLLQQNAIILTDIRFGKHVLDE